MSSTTCIAPLDHCTGAFQPWTKRSSSSSSSLLLCSASLAVSRDPRARMCTACVCAMFNRRQVYRGLCSWVTKGEQNSHAPSDPSVRPPSLLARRRRQDSPIPLCTGGESWKGRKTKKKKERIEWEAIYEKGKSIVYTQTLSPPRKKRGEKTYAGRLNEKAEAGSAAPVQKPTTATPHTSPLLL